MTRVIGIVGLVFVAIFGSIVLLHTPSSRPRAASPHLDSFARRITDADSVVATVPFIGADSVLIGARAKRIVDAVCQAKELGPGDATTSFTLKFYQGSSLLGTIGFSSGWFVVDHWQFSDATGTLEALEQELKTNPLPAAPSPPF